MTLTVKLACGHRVMCIDTDDEIPDDTWCWTKGRPVGDKLVCPSHNRVSAVVSDAR